MEKSDILFSFSILGQFLNLEFYNMSSTLQIGLNKFLTLKFCQITAPVIIKPLLVLGRRSIMKESMNIMRANVIERDLIIITGHFVHLNYGLILSQQFKSFIHLPLSHFLSTFEMSKENTFTQSQNTHFFHIHYFGMSILDKIFTKLDANVF